MAAPFPNAFPPLFPLAAPLPPGVTRAAARLGWNAQQQAAAAGASLLIAQCPDDFDMLLSTFFDMEGSTTIAHNATQRRGWWASAGCRDAAFVAMHCGPLVPVPLVPPGAR